MKNEDFVLIYLKYIKIGTNMYEVYVWFMIEFSKNIFEILIIYIFWIYVKYVTWSYK